MRRFLGRNGGSRFSTALPTSGRRLELAVSHPGSSSVGTAWLSARSDSWPTAIAKKNGPGFAACSSRRPRQRPATPWPRHPKRDRLPAVRTAGKLPCTRFAARHDPHHPPHRPRTGSSSPFHLPRNLRNSPDNPTFGPLTFAAQPAYDGMVRGGAPHRNPQAASAPRISSTTFCGSRKS